MGLVVGLSKWNSIPIPILVPMQSCLSWIDPGRPAILVEKFGHEFFFLFLLHFPFQQSFCLVQCHPLPRDSLRQPRGLSYSWMIDPWNGNLLLHARLSAIHSTVVQSRTGPLSA